MGWLDPFCNQGGFLTRGRANRRDSEGTHEASLMYSSAPNLTYLRHGMDHHESAGGSVFLSFNLFLLGGPWCPIATSRAATRAGRNPSRQQGSGWWGCSWRRSSASRPGKKLKGTWGSSARGAVLKCAGTGTNGNARDIASGQQSFYCKALADGNRFRARTGFSSLFEEETTASSATVVDRDSHCRYRLSMVGSPHLLCLSGSSPSLRRGECLNRHMSKKVRDKDREVLGVR